MYYFRNVYKTYVLGIYGPHNLKVYEAFKQEAFAGDKKDEVMKARREDAYQMQSMVHFAVIRGMKEYEAFMKKVGEDSKQKQKVVEMVGWFNEDWKAVKESYMNTYQVKMPAVVKSHRMKLLEAGIHFASVCISVASVCIGLH